MGRLTQVDGNGDQDPATDADVPDDLPVSLCPCDVGAVDLDLKHGLDVVEVRDDILDAGFHAMDQFVLLAEEFEGEDGVL